MTSIGLAAPLVADLVGPAPSTSGIGLLLVPTGFPVSLLRRRASGPRRPLEPHTG